MTLENRVSNALVDINVAICKAYVVLKQEQTIKQCQYQTRYKLIIEFECNIEEILSF